MALINKAANEITVKLVYYGPGLCGKTTNLEKIYADPKMSGKGKMLSVATETDRTLFFDFMPLDIGTIRGQKVRVQLYTVPGQVFYDATRRLVLRGADGVVFVADSQRPMADNNLDSFRNLRENLVLNRIDPDKIPIVLQYNKRDLKDVLSVEELDRILNSEGRHPTFEAVALAGKGVTETLKKGVALILASLAKGVDTALAEGPSTRPSRMVPRATAAPAAAPEVPAAPVAPGPSAAAIFRGDEDPFAEESAPVAAVAEPEMEMDMEAVAPEVEVEPPAPEVELEPAPSVSPGGVEWEPTADEEPMPEDEAGMTVPLQFESEEAPPPRPVTKPIVPDIEMPAPPPKVIAEPAPPPKAPAEPAISPELVRAVYQGNEQTLTLLRSLVADLEQQQAMLKKFVK